MLLLHGLEHIIDHADPQALADSTVRDQLFGIVSKCFDGKKNFRVAERALCMWKSDSFVNFCMQHREVVMPRVIPALVHAAAEHWNVSVKKMVGQVLQILDRMDPDLFDNVCTRSSCGSPADVRRKAETLNPPEDLEAIAAAKEATKKALGRAIEDENLSIFTVAVGHDLGSGSFSRVRYAKLIVSHLPQVQCEP